MLVLCGTFSNSVFAEITCSSKEQCGSLLSGQAELFQEADALYRSFVDCVDNCGFLDYSDWSKCGVQYKGEKKLCSEVASIAKSKTGVDYDYGEIQKKLNDLKTTLGSNINGLKLAIQAFSKVDTKEVLSLENQKNPTDLKTFFDKAIDLLVKMVGLAAFVLLIIGGFRLLVAAGNDNEVQKAKTMLTYAIIGLVVALLAYIIVAAVQGILYS